jgi:very-short-patch-repair endonuclease
MPSPLVGEGWGEGWMSSNATSLAKNLRRRQTDAERLLWKYLRSRRFEGIKFRRQQPIGQYVVDFVSFEKQIIVEVDGGQHASEERDRERDERLVKQGFRVLRFWNHHVLQNTEGVLETIRKDCQKKPLR